MWKELVHSYSDIKLIGYRKNISRLAYEEIDYSNNLFNESYLDAIKETINKAVERLVQKKKDKCRELKLSEPYEISRLKREVDREILKQEPDKSTEAGKIVNFLMQGNLRDRKFIPSGDLLILVESIIDRVLFDRKSHEEKFLFLFNPGRPNLTRIRVDKERLEKMEILFDRNWTFEASWVELESKEIVFCGGNGLNNTEVLHINPNILQITKKKSFEGRSGHALVEVNKSVYCFGGNRGKLVEKLNLCQNDWEGLADLPYRLTRAAAFLIENSILLSGIDCINIYGYNLSNNTYSDLGNSLEAHRTKNKILFVNGNLIYCICGNKVLYTDYKNTERWEGADIIDRDWWTYCKPVVHKNCAYFIKYFVRNLWKLNLNTFQMVEIPINEIPDAN